MHCSLSQVVLCCRALSHALLCDLQLSALQGSLETGLVLANASAMPYEVIHNARIQDEEPLGMAIPEENPLSKGICRAGNVLLTSCSSNPHGFCAKISDFGLARNLDLVSRVETKTTGTVTHMPPEVLSAGIISKARFLDPSHAICRAQLELILQQCCLAQIACILAPSLTRQDT